MCCHSHGLGKYVGEKLRINGNLTMKVNRVLMSSKFLIWCVWLLIHCILYQLLDIIHGRYIVSRCLSNPKLFLNHLLTITYSSNCIKEWDSLFFPSLSTIYFIFQAKKHTHQCVPLGKKTNFLRTLLAQSSLYSMVQCLCSETAVMSWAILISNWLFNWKVCSQLKSWYRTNTESIIKFLIWDRSYFSFRFNTCDDDNDFAIC